MQRENRERNFNNINTHRLKVGCVMHYSTVPWNLGFSSLPLSRVNRLISPLGLERSTVYPCPNKEIKLKKGNFAHLL